MKRGIKIDVKKIKGLEGSQNVVLIPLAGAAPRTLWPDKYRTNTRASSLAGHDDPRSGDGMRQLGVLSRNTKLQGLKKCEQSGEFGLPKIVARFGRER